MKKLTLTLIAFAALPALAFAQPGSSGDSRYATEEFSSATAVRVEAVKAAPETTFVIRDAADESEQRRLDEKNGSKG